MEFTKPNRQKTQQMPPSEQGAPHAATSTQPVPDEKTINIKISLGALPKLTRKKLPSKSAAVARTRQLLLKKRIIIASIATIAIAGSLAASALIGGQAAKEDTTHTAIVENLEYQTVLPSGKTISELGGWQRVSPQASTPVYAYTDTIGSVSISVSQQPLPDNLMGASGDPVAELAKKFNATNEIDAGGTTVHIGTSAKGPQSALFSKNSLLIMIKSQKKIDDKSWAQYIKSLN